MYCIKNWSNGLWESLHVWFNLVAVPQSVSLYQRLHVVVGPLPFVARWLRRHAAATALIMERHRHGIGHWRGIGGGGGGAAPDGVQATARECAQGQSVPTDALQCVPYTIAWGLGGWERDGRRASDGEHVGLSVATRTSSSFSEH